MELVIHLQTHFVVWVWMSDNVPHVTEYVITDPGRAVIKAKASLQRGDASYRTRLSDAKCRHS